MSISFDIKVILSDEDLKSIAALDWNDGRLATKEEAIDWFIDNIASITYYNHITYITESITPKFEEI